MANDVKSSAEKAREERKARIEKTSEKQAIKKEKKANQTITQKRLKKIIPIVIIVLAILIGALYYFGVFHRAIAAIKYDNGESISIAEYEYYYKYMYNVAYYYSNMYDTYYSAYYGEGAGAVFTGFDCTLTPANQEYSETAQSFVENLGFESELDSETYGENPTWADALESISIDMCTQIESVYNAAIADGYELSEEDQASIDEEIEELRETASESNYALTAYLMNEYGRGMNESLYKEIRTKQAIASAYLNDKYDEFTNGVTDEDIQAEYDANPGDYQLISFYYFSFTAEVATNTEEQEVYDDEGNVTETIPATEYTDEELEAMTEANIAEEKANADAFLASATADNFASLCYQYVEDDYKEYYDASSDSYSEEYFLVSNLNQSNLESYLGEEAGEWAFDSSRVVGDKQVFEITDDDGCTTYYIILLNTTPTRDDVLQPRTVRHILFSLTEEQTVTDDDGNTTTETVDKRTMEEARALAEETLAKWQAGDATEDSFIELVGELSEDSGSADNGGVYEDIYADGTDEDGTSYVTEFVDWMYADGRKVGDVGIVETDYGCHIMYMSAISEKTEWEQTIIETLATNQSNDLYDSIIGDEGYNMSISNTWISRIQNRLEDYAAKVIANAASDDDTATAE